MFKIRPKVAEPIEVCLTEKGEVEVMQGAAAPIQDVWNSQELCGFPKQAYYLTNNSWQLCVQHNIDPQPKGYNISSRNPLGWQERHKDAKANQCKQEVQ